MGNACRQKVQLSIEKHIAEQRLREGEVHMQTLRQEVDDVEKDIEIADKTIMALRDRLLKVEGDDG